MSIYKNDEELLNEIHDKTNKKLKMYVTRRSCDPSIVDDILQEVYLEVYRHIEVIRNHENCIGWVYKTAANKTKKLNSICKRYCYYHIAFGDSIENIPDHERATSDLVYQEINKILEEDEVKLLKKRYDDGYRIKDLAKESGITESGIKMRLSRMRKKARKSCSLHEFLQ